jgi:stearoyl-CoA desaturase (delta-9 desaturase)
MRLTADQGTALERSSTDFAVGTLAAAECLPGEIIAARGERLPLPAATQPVRIAWGYAFSIATLHLLALFACLPWLFSWTGVVLAVAGTPLFGLLGITLCYHRLLTHQGLKCPKWLERTLATFGVCCLQDAPARWVAIHRMHHKHSDESEDPHSPLVTFWWSHVGWLLIEHREHSNVLFFEKYARDVLRDPYYLWLERRLNWLWTYIAHAVLYLVVGVAVGCLLSGFTTEALQFGLSVLVWGVFVRTVANWHITWSVNSVTHMLGYRNYETTDKSRNHWFIALLTHGEGWHNNHHADQRSCAHGHRWWEYDLTYRVILLLEAMGLATDVVHPRTQREAAQAGQANALESIAGSAPTNEVEPLTTPSDIAA